MKKFLLLSAATALMMGGMAAEATVANRSEVRKAKSESKIKKNARKKAAAGQWLPTQVRNSWYDSWAGQWESDGEITIEYNDNGQITVEFDQWGSTEYEYNADGQVTTMTYMSEFENGLEPTARYTYEYDAVVKNFVVKETFWGYESGKWIQLAVYGTDIERNSDGNVVKSTNYEIDGDGEKESGDYFTVEYGADGKATAMTLWYVERDETEMETRLVDIVWENTDGQFMEMDDDVDEEEYYIGANRIKSAKVVKGDGMPDGALINATYPDTSGSYSYVIAYNGKDILNVSYAVLDANGSYYMTKHEVDMDEEDGKWIEDGIDDREESELYDSYGLLVSSSYIDHEEDEDYISLMNCKIEYDETYGYPLIWTSYESYDGENFFPRDRQEFLAYTQLGSSAVSAVAASSAAVYYDLNGVRVNADRLAPGVYVERAGDKTRKILVK